MSRSLMVFFSGVAFLVCGLFFFANTAAAITDYDRGQYYGVNTGSIENEGSEAKKDEAPTEEKGTEGKVNVYFCGCYGDEWKQPVNEPVHETCPICGMGTKGTGCGNLLKTE